MSFDSGIRTTFTMWRTRLLILPVVGLILSTPLQARKRKATARGKWWWCSIRLWNDFVQRSVSLDFIKKVGGYGEQKTAQD